MTTISGSYAYGYTLTTNGFLSITSTGFIGGSGLLAQTGSSVVNSGRIFGGYGASGGGDEGYNGESGYTAVLLQGSNGFINNAGARIIGGVGGDGASTFRYGGGYGGGGGYGIALSGLVSISNAGTIIGGGGGYGGAGVVGGNGGGGASGIGGYGIGESGPLSNTGTIEGGYGGAGGYTQSYGAKAGVAGDGGDGIRLTNVTLSNAGAIRGGAGGAGGMGYNGQGGLVAGGGQGGDAVRANSGSISNSGTIIGGAGGTGGAGYDNGAVGGTGGAGIALAGGSIFNAGVITGGAGGDGGEGGLYSMGVVGTGGDGVVLGAGSLTNTGTIAGGAAGASGVAGGTAGIGVIVGASGQLTNGSSVSTGATIEGVIGAEMYGAGAKVINFGTIQCNFTAADYYPGGPGVYLKTGGSLTNGAVGDTRALVAGSAGVIANGVATIANFGTIDGYASTFRDQYSGVDLRSGGVVTNGAANDTAASIEGADGVVARTSAATVTNYGVIYAFYGGVVLGAGGVVTNGSAGDTVAWIGGIYDGVDITTGTVTNFGTLACTSPWGPGVRLQTSGVLTNGSGADAKALIAGYEGVLASDATVTNSGTISGYATYGGVGVSLGGPSTLTNNAGALIEGATGVSGWKTSTLTVINNGTIEGTGGAGYGVYLYANASLTNGSNTNSEALITGGGGVLAGANVTVTNFGTIEGFGTAGIVGHLAVFLAYPSTRLNAEAGSLLDGAVFSTGRIDFVSGASTISVGLDAAGTVDGAGTMVLSGGASTFYTGLRLVVSEVILEGAATTVNIAATSLAYTKLWDQSAGTLSVAAGDRIDFTGDGDVFAGTLAGAGLIDFTAGSDAFNSLTVSASDVVIKNAAVTLSGTVALSGTIAATTSSLIVAAAGATLTGGGRIRLSNAATNSLHGASASATLTNAGDKIVGAGSLGGGEMILVNDAGGLIEGTGPVALVIDTGTSTIANAGVIEAAGAGGTLVESAIDNTGKLIADGGTLTLEGAVTGAGAARIDGGTLDAAGAFTQNVTFTGETGVLELAHSTAYAGTIAGFSAIGNTSLDLVDITYSSTTTKETYSGTATSGTLTVTDGTHTATIAISGDYTANGWTIAADGHGGTSVVHHLIPAPPHAFVAAMAGFGAGAAGTPAITPQTWRGGLLALAPPLGGAAARA